MTSGNVEHMFESTASTPGPCPEVVAGWKNMLTEAMVQPSGLDDAGRIDAIRMLEELVCTATAAQAFLAAELDQSQRAEQAAQGVPAAQQGRGVAAQVALARRESHHRGQRHLGLAKIVAAELPHTWAAWRAGCITEWRATLIARETACLTREDRAAVDTAIAADATRLERMGDRELAMACQKEAYRLDPESYVTRRRKAEADRNVTLRPAPDAMTWLTALLPVKDGVAAYAALTRASDSARASGDPRSKGQVMADTLVDSVLAAAAHRDDAQTRWDATPDQSKRPPQPAPTSQPAVGVSLGLVMTDAALFGISDEPAHVEGYGPVPAELAREIVAGACSSSEQVWLHRLYTSPTTGELVAMDARGRNFPRSLARFVRLRDQFCRTPWCDAPIRHHGPRRRLRRRRTDDRRQRPGTVRGLQLRQASTPMASQTITHIRRTRDRDSHPNRSSLPVPRANTRKHPRHPLRHRLRPRRLSRGAPRASAADARRPQQEAAGATGPRGPAGGSRSVQSGHVAVRRRRSRGGPTRGGRRLHGRLVLARRTRSTLATTDQVRRPDGDAGRLAHRHRHRHRHREPAPVQPPSFSSERAMDDVRRLAGEIGPRLATGPGFREAARWVAARLRSLDYEVERQTFPVPAGDSWGVPVEAGTSANIVARPKGFDPRASYLVVGAHLDTVAVAPGAEDNASGVAVLLETARRVTILARPLPVVFVAFGGEEPRGDGDFEHHFGSLHYVAQMSPAERRNLRGMVSMDRVGVGLVVPVGSVLGTPIATRAALVRSAERLGIDTTVDPDNAASDHESFADAGLPAARLGSTPYAEYHQATDVPSVVDPEQLRRVGRVIWDWLSRHPAR